MCIFAWRTHATCSSKTTDSTSWQIKHDFAATASACQQTMLVVFAERGSGQSAGPTMSLCNWLPHVPTNTQVAAEGSPAPDAPTYHMMHGTGQMPRLQSRQQHHAVPPQHFLWRQQHSSESDQPHSEVKQQGHAPRQQHGRPAHAQSMAEKKRRQCLLEIERELLRHSSSDDEVPLDETQLPHHSAGKRRKAACTGESTQTFSGREPSLLHS